MKVRKPIVVAAVAAGLLSTGLMIAPAQAYGPEPTPSQTATPAPTPTPTPTPPPPPPPPPAPVPNGPTNPPNGTLPKVVTPGVTLVAGAVAENAEPTKYYKNRATVKLKDAPKGKAKVKSDVRLVASVAANTVYVIKMKVDKEYFDVGTALSDSSGKLSLPVFRATKTGVITFAIINPKTGSTVYVKVKIVK